MNQTIAGGQGLIRVEDGGVEEFLDAGNAEDAGLAKHGITNGVHPAEGYADVSCCAVCGFTAGFFKA
jgi:hypothetical protein